MRNLLIAAISILLWNSLLFAQTVQNPCSKIHVVEPVNTANPGENLSFSVSIPAEINKSGLKYVWSINQGKIVEGQGTSELKVSTDGLVDTTVTATVSISNLPKNCAPDHSGSGLVANNGHNFALRDEFGELSYKDLSLRIEPFFEEIREAKDTIGVVVIYGSSSQKKKHEKQIRKFLRTQKIEDSLIKIVDGGNEPELRTRLWIAGKEYNAEWFI
ncbi:MAG: hypothetical protein R2681_04770 [Pyrinomonadaceae bacterium]